MSQTPQCKAFDAFVSCQYVVAGTFVLALGASRFASLVMISMFVLAMELGMSSAAIAATCSRSW
jgi:hypothetical protein